LTSHFVRPAIYLDSPLYLCHHRGRMKPDEGEK
jgi:hypothetical protein